MAETISTLFHFSFAVDDLAQAQVPQCEPLRLGGGGVRQKQYAQRIAEFAQCRFLFAGCRECHGVHAAHLAVHVG